jgi:transposase
VQTVLFVGMPPKVHLVDHLTLEAIKGRYRRARDPVEVRRWHLLQLVAQQWSIKQAAEIVGLSYDYAKDIIRRYNREGPESLRNRSKDRPAPPTRSLLTPDQQTELRLLLQQPAPDGGEWTGPKVARWIARKTGRSRVWPQRGWEYLRRLQD